MGKSPAIIRKTDLAPAFNAANDAGFSQVSVTIITDNGQRLYVHATKAPAIPPSTNAASLDEVGKWFRAQEEK